MKVITPLSVLALAIITNGLSLERRDVDVNVIAQALQKAGLVKQYCGESVEVTGGSGANVNVNVQASQSITIPGLAGSYSAVTIEQGKNTYNFGQRVLTL